MAHATGVTWTCDRCRRPLTLPSGEAPEGWREIKSELIKENADGRLFTWEVCAGCASQVERLLINGNEVPPA